MMPTDPMEFADRVGAELSRLLGDRSRAELLTLDQNEQFSAAIGASLICVAEVLRVPVERGVPAAKLAAICARQLEGLLVNVRPTK
ncbi:MAG: hypothetical protein ABJE10_18395 [bacterium]